MCPHTDFDIIYYKDGILIRRCKDCGEIEMCTEWIWCDIPSVMVALAAIE
jgi:hypothetical protein